MDTRQPLKELDRIQNQALRFICGTFRTSPVAAAEVMANIPRLQLRRERAIIMTYERYKRLEKSLPTRVLVDTWKGRKRLKMQSFMHNATRLASELHLPENRLPIQRFSSFSPCDTATVPEIRTKQKDTAVSKSPKLEIPKNKS